LKGVEEVMYISKKESENNLNEVMNICTKVAHFKSEIKRELKDHPDYRAENVQISDDGMYIILSRKHLGVIHSVDIEIKFDLNEGGE
jgi:hypothetical protein